MLMHRVNAKIANFYMGSLLVGKKGNFSLPLATFSFLASFGESFFSMALRRGLLTCFQSGKVTFYSLLSQVLTMYSI